MVIKNKMLFLNGKRIKEGNVRDLTFFVHTQVQLARLLDRFLRYGFTAKGFDINHIFWSSER